MVFSVLDLESFPLIFLGYKSSRLLGSAPENIITYLKTDNVTYNHHRECISTEASIYFRLDCS